MAKEKRTVELRRFHNMVTITAEAPLLRPGLSLSTEASHSYVLGATEGLMKNVREINKAENDKDPDFQV